MFPDRGRLRAALAREEERFAAARPRSRRLAEQAREHWLSGVPMHWMVRWAGAFPIFVAEASGAHFTDVDGHRYLDLCLGDTGAMTGHAPPATVEAVAAQARRGMTFMLPTEDAIWLGEELSRRFGLPFWQAALTATDANRFAIRLARHLTRRPKILVFNGCYHGTVDETFITLSGGLPRSRAGNIGPPVDPPETTRVVEFNDIPALEAALAHDDVACVLAEPALTNIGIVHPERGFHAALREATRRAGTLLVLDETHTISAGPGGMTRALGLAPDVLTIGKPIAGGVPASVYGVTAEIAGRLEDSIRVDESDTGGIGGTLAGNALSLAAMRATLEHVLTEGGVRAYDPARAAVRRRRPGRHRRARAPVARGPARLPRGVLVPGAAAPQRVGGLGVDRPGARPVHASGGVEPRHPHDAVPQHGPDLPRDNGRGRRPPHPRLPRQRRGPRGLIRPGEPTRLPRPPSRDYSGNAPGGVPGQEAE